MNYGMITQNQNLVKNMDTDSFIVYVKTNDIYKDRVKMIYYFKLWNRWTVAYGKNKQVIGLMKDELGREIMKQIAWLRAKTYSYLKGNDDEYKKAKKCVL